MKTLETERLVLRKFKREDAKDVYEQYATDHEVVHYLTWPIHQSLKETENLLNNWIQQYEDDSIYNWAIVLKETNTVIGNINAVNYFPSINALEIGYVIARKYWNKGITSEALNTVKKYLFEEEKINNIIICCDVRNKASQKVMEKNGFVKEGLLRQAAKNNTGIVDIYRYSLTLKEYNNK